MEKPESSRRPPAKRESCLQREDSKRQRVSTLAEVSEGLEGKNSGFLRTSLIRELRNVLDEYPDDGQILKEMIQNAEDAGAKCVKILADSRTFPSDEDTHITEGNPYLQFFQGPALCVYNNEQFQEKDWEGIRRLHTSVKEKDPLKVGRFGLGFKSVFHLTDRLVIISGQFMMFMDPFNGADGDCTRQRLAERKGRELQYCLDKIFLSEFPRSHGTDFDSGFFSGTLFWFPLRQQKSELSDTLYTEKSLKDLLQAFKTEASSMLLFLQNLQKIEVHERDYRGTKPVFTVELSEKCVNAVRAERSRFKNSIRAASEQLPLAPVCSRSEVEMQLSDLRGRFQNKERWLVVNYLAGRQSASEQLLRLCRDSNLCYQPHVGVAMPLGGQHNFQSHLFCFLPLPLEMTSPTGLPVHVHGFFALSQNRRHIKWPTADQLNYQAHMEPSLVWNRLLVTELLPLAYVALLHRLQEIHNRTPEEFYKAWPDMTRVGDRWQPLVRTLYQTLSRDTVFHTSVPSDTWIPLSKAVLQKFSSSTDPDVVRAVINIYIINRESLVQLPSHVMSGLEQLRLLNSAQTITPSHVSELILTCHQQLGDTEKLLLLQYLCSHGNEVQLLLDRCLLPLQNGSFGVFRRRGGGDEVFWCEDQMQELFPGLENMMCRSSVSVTVKDHLKRLAESCHFSLRVLDKTSGDVARLMESVQKRHGHSSLTPRSQESWIRHVWTFLQSTPPWNTDLSRLYHLKLLPCLEGSQLNLLQLKGIYISISAPGMPELNRTLSSSLSKLGITAVLLPSYVSDHKRILGGLVQYPTTRGILAALEKVSGDPVRGEKAERDFNTSSTEAERESIRKFIANAEQLDPQRVSILTDLQLFTDMKRKQLVSVRQVHTIGPRDLPPVPPPWSLLRCDGSARFAALKLGASEVSLNTIAEKILKSIQENGYSSSDIKNFMVYFLNNYELMANQSLTNLARNIQFVPSSSGQLYKPRDLYDAQNGVLRELFLREDMFPCDEFAQSRFISKLKKLGLRDETNVREDDLISTAQRIEGLLKQVDGGQTAARKAESLWTLLSSQWNRFDLSRLARIQCMPCLQDRQKPSDYPKTLPLRSYPAIVCPCEIALYTDLMYCGSTRAVTRPGMPEGVAKRLTVVRELPPQDVISHLQTAISHYNIKESHQYKLIFHRVFEWLNSCKSTTDVSQFLKETDCVLVESEGRFCRPKQFWVNKRYGDIDLRPYRFLLPSDMSSVSDLFLRCGSCQYQDDQLLQEVLSEVKKKHETGTVSKSGYTRDMRLVKVILYVLKESDSGRNSKVLIPIKHKQKDVLRFRYARDCTLWTESLHDGFAIDGLEDEEIVFVHTEIDADTAVRLGAVKMKDRALTGIEDLDFGYGQHEELTDRLYNLLKDSYTDGFSVPKELIQNADDAGATEVKFLLDERENMDARTNLINKQMASLQGPALWAFNNAIFSDEDFKNIVRLGAGAKGDDVTKVGKFGLGFNSVYNLTDAPSFISRHTMAIFDPQVKYLKGQGLKLDFTKSINRALVVRMPEQFKPFQGVFGCRLTRDSEVNYKGTLFRFPFRTEEQAADSKIKAEAYSRSKRKVFIRMLLENGGNLLLFTQHVRKLQIYYIGRNDENPAKAECLLTLNKDSCKTVLSSQPVSLSCSVLHYAVDTWSKGGEVKVKEELTMRLIISHTAQRLFDVSCHDTDSQWKIVWTCGSEESTSTCPRYTRGQHLPLAAAAVSVCNQRIAPLCRSPTGFYRSGHLFCFLPLPMELVSLDLPVHINGTFELASNRRSLLRKTEDDVAGSKSDWNTALFEDAVCRAYLLLLENLHQEAANEADFLEYFNLWPKANGKNYVLSNFYLYLVKNEYKIFPDSMTNLLVSFSAVVFMDPELRASDVGPIAWDALRYFWNEASSLVDVPACFHEQMNALGHQDILNEKIITESFFYENIFFPNIKNSWWTTENRDRLVLRALMHPDYSIQNLVKNIACIPCLGTTILRCPRELIHPNGRAAKLYLPSEGRFPQKSKSQGRETGTTVNFSSTQHLERLADLGMLTDRLENEMLIERAQSVENLARKNWDQAMNRAQALIEYLSVEDDPYPPEVIDIVSNTKFLPVMVRPDDWQLPWKSDGENDQLESPRLLFSHNLKDLVACTAKILDCSGLQMNFLNSSEKERALNKMGLRSKADINDSTLFQMVAEQLFTIVHEFNTNPHLNKDLVQNICTSIYKHLNDCLQSKSETEQLIERQFSGKRIIWVESGFEFPFRVAFCSKYNCKPYLFELGSDLRKLRLFFEIIGVKDNFDVEDILNAFKELYTQFGRRQLHGDTVELVSRLAQLLWHVLVEKEKSCLEATSDLYLPDRQRYLQPVALLCLDDCDWLRESDSMKFVHDSISPAVAKMLGVSSKRESDFNHMCGIIPFGQRELLTNRIKRLLEAYTFDNSIFKELIQNADDAGATEIKFIKDFRHHKIDKVMSGWDNLQGPALCIYNNKSFTAADMEGIKNIGLGSKEQDTLKTGRYGVGFNVVYHITDVPSFWTRQDDKEDVICVFDPACQYLANISPQNPGVQIRDISRLKQNYPDMFACYLDNCIDMTSPGTLFRLPLRTSAMAELSKIKQTPLEEVQMNGMLEKFQEEIVKCLLFLNNVRTIGIYTVDRDGSLKADYEVSVKMTESYRQEMEMYNRHLSQLTENFRLKQIDLVNLQPAEVCLQKTLTHFNRLTEDWLVVCRVGFWETSKLCPEVQHLWEEKRFYLPRGGVAVRLPSGAGSFLSRATNEREEHLAFCCLPLPVRTNLPVHVNGEFILDHETRRSIWDSEDDGKTKWNKAIASQVIVPAYVSMILMVKDILFHKEVSGMGPLETRLAFYESLFPQLASAPSDFWKYLIKSVYQQLGRPELDILPVTDAGRATTTWVPVVKNCGFPGYFSNLETYFENCREIRKSSSQALSNPFSQEESPFIEAKKLTELLVSLNMKVISTSFRLYEDFTTSGVAARMVTPDSVTRFLRSSGNGSSDDCNIEGLPCPLASTSLKSVDSVKRLISFIEESTNFKRDLKGLPLCLRRSQTLHFFQETPQEIRPILSRYGRLFPLYSECFVHEAVSRHIMFLKAPRQQVTRQLDIHTFADMLPGTLREDHYKTGHPCLLDESKPMPATDWIKEAWKFFQDLVKKSDKDCVSEGRRILECLSEWSLIPVKWRSTDSINLKLSQISLYPMKDMPLVLYLTDKVDTNNACLWEILKLLPLAHLDLSRLPDETFALKLAASISNPLALIQALNSLKHIPGLSSNQALKVISYFSNNLRVLKSSCGDEVKMKQYLRELPLFPSVDWKPYSIHERTLVICIETNIPIDGLVAWSKKLDYFLMFTGNVSNELAKYLNFTEVSCQDFYTHHLLPTLQFLPRTSIVTHIKFLKDNLQRDKAELNSLISQLQKTAFIEDTDGHLKEANKFYSPHVPVFKLMLSPDSFPPKPYSEIAWKTFMKQVGIIAEVTVDMISNFARRIAEDGRNGITKNVEKASLALVDCLFHTKDLSKDVFSLVKDIPFVMPSRWRREEANEGLAKITPAFCTERLVSFSESCRESHLYLVWSSSAILNSDSDPYILADDKDREPIGPQLGLQARAPACKVIQHVENVSRALTGQRSEQVLQTLGPNIGLVKKVMDELYTYFADCTEDLQALKSLPVIYHIKSNQMLLPENVVIEMNNNDEIEGLLMKAPYEFGHFFELFKRLGVAEHVTADHYARVLQRIKADTTEKPLHVEEMKKVKQAIEGLFSCVTSKSSNKSHLSVKEVYFPSEEEVLKKSSELTFVDNIALRDRLKSLPSQQSFFIGFQRLRTNPFPPQSIRHFAVECGMTLLTSVVKEIVPQHLTNQAFESQVSKNLADKVTHPLVIEAVVRAMYNLHEQCGIPFPENPTETIGEQLSRLVVREVRGLETILTVNGKIIPQSEIKVPSFVHKQEDSPKACIVYIEADADETHRKDFLNDLAAAMGFVLDFETMWLEHIVDSPERAMKCMDKKGFMLFNDMRPCQSFVIPLAGTYIPVSCHCYLDNSFYRFKDGEHVGFEAYDPCVEVDDPEETTPTYIFGVIRHEASGGGQEESNLLTKKYLVDLGSERGLSEIYATRLYKFIRKVNIHGVQDVAVHSSSGTKLETPEPSQEPCQPRDLKVVLKETRRLLVEALQLPESERKRVHKRLILKWHPDKNPGNEPFCTKVMQALNSYLDRLKQGKALNVDEEDDSKQRPPSSQPTRSPFFEHMNRRAKSHKAHYEQQSQRPKDDEDDEDDNDRPGSRPFFQYTYQREARSSSAPNPQPGEGRRWFRQAEEDLKSARAAKGTCERGYNWVCFQCHQAVEKALKAVLYCRDANNNSLNSHDIVSLARHVNDDDVRELASALGRRVGTHTRMRYPDVLLSPSIPADVYGDQEASDACDLATRILNKTKTLL